MVLTEVQRGFTWVNTEGEVLRPGRGGLVVCAYGTHRPVLVIEEVSDDETVNLFLTAHPKSWIGVSQESEICSHELLLAVDDLAANSAA